MSTTVHDQNPPSSSPRVYLTPAQYRHARLVVCGLARDAEDAKELLEALDLLE